jgi:uncharacterized protein (TIGR02001 family)
MSLRAALLVLLAWAPALAMAQASFSVGAVSDYRYRGVSLSDGSPSLQANATYDHSSGAYAGAALAHVHLGYTQSTLQGTAYAGFARRLGEQWSVDAGATAVRFNGGSDYDYQEWYVGVARERFGTRLSVSPHYFGVGGRTLYGEVNASMALAAGLDLVGHAGYLHPQAARWLYVPPSRADFRLGLSMAFDAWTAQLAVSATRSGAALYPGARENGARRLVLGATRTF